MPHHKPTRPTYVSLATMTLQLLALLPWQNGLVTNSSSCYKALTSATTVAFRSQPAPQTVPTNKERPPLLPVGWPRLWVWLYQKTPGRIFRAIGRVSRDQRWHGSSRSISLTSPPFFMMLWKTETSCGFSGNILKDKHPTIFAASLWPIWYCIPLNWLTILLCLSSFPLHCCFPGTVPPIKHYHASFYLRLCFLRSSR